MTDSRPDELMAVSSLWVVGGLFLSCLQGQVVRPAEQNREGSLLLLPQDSQERSLPKFKLKSRHGPILCLVKLSLWNVTSWQGSSRASLLSLH